ncbi:MAG: protein kinase domain-containing protein [Vicinamibacterales bacterium]
MSLTDGAHVGPYEIIGSLGAGGMGEVYRARDPRLQRDVALKVLPARFAEDPERLARLQREAQVLASLNHPNIAAIYGLEEADGLWALVLELVEGPTLAEHLSQGVRVPPPVHRSLGEGGSSREGGRGGPVGLPIDEALPIARQVADALEAAHEQGIVHRDLKPANIKVKPDGTVKVLDFGLAKLIEPGSGIRDPRSEGATAAPTMTSPAMMTRAGVILGTAAYMSPEQARGRVVNKRADIWAFGCVLFEMLAGKRAFDGADLTDFIVAVMTKEPDWTTLPTSTPPRIVELLQRCLTKDPRGRLRDIGDARIEIDDLRAAPSAGVVVTPMHARRRERLAWAVAAIAVVAGLAGGAMGYFRSAPADTRVYHSSILPPPGQTLAAALAFSRFSLSPDGRKLAFVASTGSGLTQLWMQPLDGLPAQMLAGTAGALSPFWSPDSRFIGFYAGGKLKTIDAAGGPPLTLADTTGFPGGTWNRDNVILFSTTGAGSVIRRVAASGGAVSAATKLDTDNGETQHWSPFFLPDGRHFVYVVAGSKSGSPNDLNGIYVTALDSTERKLLVPGGSNVKYAQGYLIFLREQTLMAQPFDVGRLELTGDPVPIAEQVATGGLSGRLGAFAVSEDRVLAYRSGFATDVSQLVWFDRTGKQVGVLGEPADYGDLELSPDGKRAAVSLFDPATSNRDIWLFDVTRGIKTRFTFDSAEETASIWSSDSSHVIFHSTRKGNPDLYRKASSGVGSEETIQADAIGESPLSWSRDSRFVLYARGESAQALDVWVLPLVGDRKPFPLLQTPFNEYPAVLSSDGQWVAYVSNESGRNEVYVMPFPGPGGKWQVSTAGGIWPRWRRDGAELFYLAPDNRLMAAEVNGRGSGFDVGAVQPLFATRRGPRGGMCTMSPPTASGSSSTRSSKRARCSPSRSSSIGRRR